MSETKSIQSNFLSGELSPLLLGNIQIEQYYQGLRTASDVFVVPQGGVKRRGGCRFIDTLRSIDARVTAGTMTMPNGGTAANINDDDASTTGTTTTSIGTNVLYVVAKYDAGSAIDKVFLDVDGLQLNLVGSPDISSAYFDFQYSDDDSAWTSCGTDILTHDITTAFYRRLDVSDLGSHRYWRLVLIKDATDFTTSTISLTKFNLFTSITTDTQSKLINFNVSSEENFLLLITPGNLSAYRQDSGITKFGDYRFDVSTPEDVVDLRSETTENVCLIFQENINPIRIIYDKLGASDNPADIILDNIPFSNIPQFDFNDSLSPTPVNEVQVFVFNSFSRGQTYEVDVEGVLSKSITFAGDSTADEQQATEFNLETNLQDMPTFGSTGVSVSRTGANTYRVTISGESTKDFQLFSAYATSGSATSSVTITKSASGSPRAEDIWSPTRGWPRMAALHKGRLWIGGTRDKKQTLMASKAGDLLDFEIKEGADDEGFITTIISRNLTEITEIYPGRKLQIFTRGAEYTFDEEPITPANSSGLSQQSAHGSLFIPAVESNGAVIFADKNGKTLREFLFNFNEDSFQATDITVLSSHLIKNPVAMDFLNGTASDDSNWLFVVNNDGTVAVLNKLRSQDINAFTAMYAPHSSEAPSKFLTVRVSKDAAFFVCERTIDGSVIRSLETLDFNYFMDGAVKAATATTISGLDHLVGETVQVVADGNVVLDSRVVNNSGEITLTAAEAASYDQVEIGINFVPTIIPMPVNTNFGSGENFLRLKKIVRTNLRVYETYGLSVDGVPIANRSFGSEALNQAPEKFTGIIPDIYATAGWSRDETPTITAPDPTPFHIQAIEFQISSS